jgi:hypothetical protein
MQNLWKALANASAPVDGTQLTKCWQITPIERSDLRFASSLLNGALEVEAAEDRASSTWDAALG